MEQEITRMLWIFGAAGLLALANILLASWYNVHALYQKFDGKRLIEGVIKVIIIIFAMATLEVGYIVIIENGIVGEEVISPYLICVGTLLIYFTKVAGSLSKILGVEDYLRSRISKG